MKSIKLTLLFIAIIFSGVKLFSQDAQKLSVGVKMEKISVIYRDLITDDKGIVNKSSEELISMNKLVKDSVIVWAKRFDVNTEEGLQKFGKHTGDKLGIKAGKKIIVTFIDKAGNKENFNIWSLGFGKYKIEKAQEIKR